MRLYIKLLIAITLSSAQIYGQDHQYPVEDFYNRSIQLPIDYENPEEGTFLQYYQLSSNFDFSRPTLFFFQDIGQRHGTPGAIDKMAMNYNFYEHFNVVFYQIRGREYSYIELKNPDGSVNWEKAYRLLSADFVIEDIERIRRDLFKDHPDTQILVYGRSGGGFLIQRYLSKYSKFVNRAFIRAAPNSIIMKQLGYPEAQHFYNSLNETDATLYSKLKVVIKENTVPTANLYWILKSIPYGSENPGLEMKTLINELYEGNAASYELYLKKRGFDFSKLIKTEENMGPRDIGMSFCPVEVSAEYMVDSDPEFIDPFYECLKTLSKPYLDLIREKKVDLPSFPSLENFRKVETEVFYLAGRYDHVSDYRIGIELGNYFKNYTLFISDDNHTMAIHEQSYPLLRNAFFTFGAGSDELHEIRQSLKSIEWVRE